jgi:hypothetical protein
MALGFLERLVVLDFLLIPEDHLDRRALDFLAVLVDQTDHLVQTDLVRLAGRLGLTGR